MRADLIDILQPDNSKMNEKYLQFVSMSDGND